MKLYYLTTLSVANIVQHWVTDG